MIHQPLENLIFNSYKKLKKASIGDGKKLMEKIGDGGYRKLVMDLMRQGKTSDPGSDLVLQTAQTLQDVVNLTCAARKAFGEARLATATKAAEFMRVIFGSETTEVAAGGGYYCQKCMIQPKYDYHWTKAKGVGKNLCDRRSYSRASVHHLQEYYNHQKPERTIYVHQG